MGELLVLSCLLGLDTLRVSGALGAAGSPPSLDRRIICSFAACEASAPFVGFLVGATVAASTASAAAIVTPLLLIVYAASVIALPARTISRPRRWLMVVLPLSFSLDNLIAGAALGLIGTSIFVAAPLLGIVSGLMAMVGLRLGRVVSDRVGRPAEVFAAVALFAIAVGIVG